MVISREQKPIDVGSPCVVPFLGSSSPSQMTNTLAGHVTIRYIRSNDWGYGFQIVKRNLLMTELKVYLLVKYFLYYVCFCALEILCIACIAATDSATCPPHSCSNPAV